MGKREVIARALALAALWIALVAIAGQVVGGRTGRLVEAAGVIALIVTGWATFNQNARLFGSVVGAGRTSARKAALTFDDGPTPEYTGPILDALREAGVRATFFVLGRQVRRHPELARRIVEEGHELASHGDDHSLLVFASPHEVARQLRTAEESAAEAAGDGAMAPLFRAPHGYRGPFTAAVVGRLGYRMVGWAGSVWDTARPGVERIVERSSALLRPGAILLLHDGDGSDNGDDRSQTVAAVPSILAEARGRGIELVTVSELAGELRPARRRGLRAAALLVGVAAIVFVLAQKFDLTLAVVADVFTTAAPLYVLAALFANLASVAGKALTWKAAVDAVPDEAGEERPKSDLRDIVPAIFIGFLLNTVLFARLGEVARISVLRRRLAASGQNLPVPAAVGTVLCEQFLSGVTLLFVLAGIAGFVSIPGWAVRLLGVLFGVLLALGAAAAALELWAWVRRRRISQAESEDQVERWWNLLGISVSTVPAALRQGQAVFRRPTLLAAGLFYSTLTWLMQLVGIYCTMRAYGINAGLGVASVVFLTSNLVQLFPIVPGNVGVFQGATTAALAFSTSVSASRALTFSIGLQLIEALLGVGLGFVFLSLEGLSVRELRTEAEAESGDVRPRARAAPPRSPV